VNGGEPPEKFRCIIFKKEIRFSQYINRRKEDEE